MKKRNFVWFIAAFAVLTTLSSLLVACGDDDDNGSGPGISGTWSGSGSDEDEEETLTLTFKKNGTGTWKSVCYDEDGKETEKGTFVYEMESDTEGHVSLIYNEGGETEEDPYVFKIKGSKMYLYDYYEETLDLEWVLTKK